MDVKPQQEKRQGAAQERNRLEKDVAEQKIKPASFMKILGENKDAWLYLVFAVIATIINGSSAPLVALLNGLIFRVSVPQLSANWPRLLLTYFHVTYFEGERKRERGREGGRERERETEIINSISAH